MIFHPMSLLSDKGTTKDSHMQGWASMCGFFSFMPPYWRMHDITASRAKLRVRLDVAWNEVAVRMIPAANA